MARAQVSFEIILIIVAIAIALIVLGFFSGFFSGTSSISPNDAKSVIPRMFGKVAQSNYGVEIQKDVEFSEGSVITQANIVSQSSIPELKVQLLCASISDAICSNVKSPVPINSTQIGKVKAKALAAVAACTDGTGYFVVIGTRADDVSSACTSRVQQSSGLIGR